MADFFQYLAILDSDPDDTAALAGLVDRAPSVVTDPAAGVALAATRKAMRERGRPDVVHQLLDVELGTLSGSGGDRARRADLLLEKAAVLEDDLLDSTSAIACLKEVLALRPDDENAIDQLDQIETVRANWQKVAEKFVAEATAATDRQLATQLFTSAAEIHARYQPGAPEVEQLLRRALDSDPRNRKAAGHLERLLRVGSRWEDLAVHLEARIEQAQGKDERIAALLGLAEVSRARLGKPEQAVESVKKIIALDPGQPQALKVLGDAYAAEENWQGLVMLYGAALKARRGSDREELAMLLQVGMIQWRHLDDLDGAEEYFRRIRKVEPAHPAALDFYRAYHPARGEGAKLLQMLRQAEKALPAIGADPASDARARALAIEIAELAEAQVGNPEKAIDAWKQLLRQDPTSVEARVALKRLYARTEKWNALLDLMKEEIDRLPEDDVAGRIARLGDVVDIYRSKLRLDVMVINTLATILKLDSEYRPAIDELAEKYRALGRWNDLITILGKKAELATVPLAERIAILRETADLWVERFGNHAQAIRPLERILEVSAPLADADTVARLKDIYTRRRQWRQLIGLLGKEADALAGVERRIKMAEMARLAAERVGDNRLAIELHNQVLAEFSDAPEIEETLAALAALYEREKRWLPLAEMLRRQRDRAATPAEAVSLLEKLGALLADRVGAPAQAAEVFAEILKLDPAHTRALRTLRELYAAAGDYDGLERLYGELGQWDELVDALGTIADRLDDRPARLAVLARAAAIAQRRADEAGAAASDGAIPGPVADKLARVWERLLSVDATHGVAAAALAPLYARQEKWARLLPVLEVQLAVAPDDAARLARMLEIRELCEHKLGSRSLAFSWAVRGLEIDPAREASEADVLRLASEPEQWVEVGALFDRVLAPGAAVALAPEVRLRLARTAARIAAGKLAQPDKARELEREVLRLAPDDPVAVAHLEELATQLSDWPALVASVRRRAEREPDPAAKLELWFEVSRLQEQRLADLDGAAATYQAILDLDGKNLRALEALSAVHEARGDWDALDGVLDRQLALTHSPDDRATLLIRMGVLEETSLDRPDAALTHYLDAVEAMAATAPAPAVIAAAERYLDDAGAGARVTVERRVQVAEALLPHIEEASDPLRLARALEVLRVAKSPVAGAPLDVDRRLLGLYDGPLAAPALAWDAAVRVLADEPGDHAVRPTLERLATALGRHPQLAVHLAAALAARQQGGAGPDEVRVLATDLAALYSERLGDPAAAEKAWLVVLDADPTHPDAYVAFDALAQTYRGHERWTDLRALLLRRADTTLDGEVRKAALLDLAALEEDVLHDPARAIAAHRRVLDVDAAHLPAYKALERLHAETRQWRELEELLGRELDYTPEKGQVDLIYRRAELRALQLGEREGAVDLLEEVVTRRRGHADARELLETILPEPPLRLRVARLLEPLYEQDQLWKDLVMVLRAQHELAAGPVEAVDLLARIAGIEEEKLSAARAAFDTRAVALATEPRDDRARAALPRLAQWIDRWPDVCATWEQVAQAVPAHDASLRAELYGELGGFYDERLADTERAIGAYRKLAEADPTNPEVVGRATAALARLYEEEERWGELRDTLRKQAEWADPDDRKGLLAKVARLEEEQLGARDAALTTWRDVLAEDPEDLPALDALERIYQAMGATPGQERWLELIEILRRRVEITDDPAEQKRQLRRVAELHERRLDSPGEAIAAHLEILDHVADDADTLGELARLYRAAARHADLLEVLERRLALLDDGGAGGAVADANELRFEVANLLGGPMAREREALDRWAEVLQRDPVHAGALAAVERALDDDELREPAAEILRPLYEAVGHDDKLAALIDRLAAGADDVRDRLAYLREVAQLREHRLADPMAAFRALIAAAQAAVTEPELVDVLKDVDRLAEQLGREDELIDVFQALAPEVLDGEVQRRLYLDVADLARAVRGDVALAREHYQKVLDAQSDDRRSLLALESIHRESGEHARLWDILTRKAELAGDDSDEKVSSLAEAATLCAGPLGRPDEAIAGWEQVLELAPERRDAVAALDQLYRASTRWHDLVDLYERRLGFAMTVEEAVSLRLKLAAIHDAELRDAEAAVENYAAALGGDTDNPEAIAALERYLDDPVARTDAAAVLEPLYVSNQQWQKLVRIHEITLEATTEPAERLRLTRFVARLYEDQLEDLEGAARWYARLFRENPVDPTTRDQLQRLAMILDNWQVLAQTYQAWLDDEGGESPTVRDVAVTLATVYDRRLDDVDRGAGAYRRALAAQIAGATPPDREIFTRLEALLTRAGRWALLVDVYEEAIAGADDAGRRADLLARMGRVLEERLDDRRRAVEAWREVLAVAADEAALGTSWQLAAVELDRLYRLEAQWYDLAELLTTRIERAPDAERATIQLTLADVLERELKDLTSALDQYEAVLRGAAPDRALPHLERLIVADEHRERIVELLEPVYRQRDWWQKLVVILDAKLAYVDDPPAKVATLCEIAQIHESRGGDAGMAFDALARAWKLEPSDTGVFEALTHQASRLGAWDELVEVLEAGVAGTFDPDVGALVHARVAEVHETQRGDHPAAIASWRKVLEQRADDPMALPALDRLLAVEGRAEELVAVVERRAELADDAGVRLVLLHRVAGLYDEVLELPREAIAAYRNVLGVDDSDETALDALERLYRVVADYPELAATLARKIELATDPVARRALRLAAAKVDEEELGDIFDAIAQLQAILGEVAGDAEALAELDRLYLRERMWPDLLEIVDRRALLATDARGRADLAFRAARLVEQELLEPGDAITRYGGILQIDAAHAPARAALEALLAPAAGDEHVDAAGAVLERLYRQAGDTAALVALYERRLTVPSEPSVREAQWAQLAEIHEIMRGDVVAASRTWARALAETPADLALFAPLERLAGERGAWPELAAILDERLKQLADPELELAYATRLGQIHEDAIGDPIEAATAYRRALAVASDEREPLAALDRVLLRSARWAELCEVLTREADVAGDDAQAADFLFRLGDTLETSLDDAAGAIAAYRDALDRAPQHRAARGSLERLLGTADDHRAAIIEVLEPLYEADADWPRLVDLLTAKLAVVRDHLDRAGIYQRIATLSEQKLRDAVRALDAAGGWLGEDPASGEALAEVERIAAELGRWGEVAARLLGIVGNADVDRDVRLGLMLRLGVVQLDRVGDVPGATRTFTGALELDAECQPALEALERIHRGMGDQRALAAVLARRGELAYEPAAKRGAYAEVGDLRERMGELAEAIAAWKIVLELDEGDREALHRLALLHERAGDTRALIETLEQAARFAPGPAEEKQVRVRIGHLESAALGEGAELGRAVAAWMAVLDLDDGDLGALEALEALHTRAGDWLAVQDVLTRRLEHAQGSAGRIAILAAMARLAEDRRDALDDAIGHWFTVLETDNAHAPAYDQLERLLAKAERYNDLVELLERRAEVEGTLGRADDEIRTLARAADIWEGPLDDPDAAGELLEKILRREPGSVSALTRLAKIYERSADWDKCGEVLQQALALGPRGRDAADLFFRLGEVAHKASGDLDTAQAHWRAALGHDASHLPTLAALEKLARERQDWAGLVELLVRREPLAVAAADKLALALELSELYRRLGRAREAIPLLERAVQAAPTDVAILTPLADLYFAEGLLDRAAPIYDRLAEEAKSKRQMKDVAKYRQRQGSILEARADLAGAQAAYEEAFRVNPTDVPTMAGLGRIYLGSKAWEKARRVYRSLVLQTIDADASITKGEVYWALGVIHLELDEAPKAKGMFQRGLELEPDNAKIRDALARLG